MYTGDKAVTCGACVKSYACPLWTVALVRHTHSPGPFGAVVTDESEQVTDSSKANKHRRYRRIDSASPGMSPLV